MRRLVLLTIPLVLAVLLAGCGRYGKPLRAGEAEARASGVTAHDTATCEDPQHDHLASSDGPAAAHDPAEPGEEATP